MGNGHRDYLLFGGIDHQEWGGAYDFIGAFKTLADAKSFALSTHRLHPCMNNDLTDADDFEKITWWHVFCLTSQEIVASHNEFHTEPGLVFIATSPQEETS